MKKDIAKIWVEALRSGKYKQGKGRLKLKDNSFCCLGVLCDLYGKEKNTEWDNHKIDTVQYKLFLDHSTSLPIKVMDWSGMKNIKGVITLTGISLVELNDKGSSFQEIADIIENYVEVL